MIVTNFVLNANITFLHVVSRELLSVPQCLGDMCACPNGYTFHSGKKLCELNYISFPASGKKTKIQ